MPKIKTLDPVLDSMDLIVCFIKKEMKKKKITQKALAEELGLGQSNISYKLCSKNLYVEDLIRIFRVIGVTKEQIGELML